MHAQDLIRKWGPGGPAHELNERAGAQAHFIDTCRMLGVAEPADPDDYCFERGPAWLAQAHEALDRAVAAAYGWTDYTSALPDNEILRRLLALNLERAKARQ